MKLLLQQVRPFVWLFCSLVMLALLSQPGATHDEWYHAASTWCAQGIRSPYCSDIGVDPGNRFSALVNLNAVNCKLPPQELLYCPTPNTGQGRPLVNNGLYPGGFYYILSWFVVPSSEQSFILLRSISALAASVVLCMMFWLLPVRHRLVLSLLIITMFSSTGFFLLASINPSSWAFLGVGTGWLPIHAAWTESGTSIRRKFSLMTIGVLALSMAGGSRWDAIPFTALMIFLVCVHVLTIRIPNHKFVMIVSVACTLLLAVVLLEMFSPLSPVHYLGTLTTFTEGQPDNIIFLSSNLLQAFPGTLQALGSVPTMTDVMVPGVVLIASFVVLGYFLLVTFNERQRLQYLGMAAGAIAVGVSTAAQIAVTDARDFGLIEPRYGLPLVTAVIGWWFLQSPERSILRVVRGLKTGAIVATGSFSLVAYTLAERFVDRQTNSIRFLPEGPDQWWWSLLPFGPNVTVFLAPIFFWFFVRSVSDTRAFAPLGNRRGASTSG